MDLLAQTESDHWVKRLATSDKVQPDEIENGNYLNYVKRIYLEHCSLHSLNTLIRWRHTG